MSNPAPSSQNATRPTLGKLKPPYPVEHCANVDCLHGSLEGGAFLYRDLESDKLVIFCDDCARHVELNNPERFKLVAL